jgi:hypothetical protein
MFFNSSAYRFPRWLILPAMAVGIFLLTELLAQHPDWVEKYYATGIYPLFATVLSSGSSLFPFSLSDILYVVLAALPFILIVLVIFRKISGKTAGKTAINALAGVYMAFYLLWGFNYFRAGLNQRLDLAEQVADTDEFLHVFDNLVFQTNAAYTGFEDIQKEEIDRLVEASYRQWASKLKIPYPAGKRRAKSITFSRFFAQAGISGYYGPFFNEVHINRHNLPLEYPFVLAHEKAHQLGITSEAEANFYAWVVCSQSNSKHLRYSANLALLRYFINHGSRLEAFSEIVARLDEPVVADLQKIRKHWLELRVEKIDQVAGKVNDAYLKSNKIEQGIQDYTGVVKYVMDFSADSLFLKQ